MLIIILENDYIDYMKKVLIILYLETYTKCSHDYEGYRKKDCRVASTNDFLKFKLKFST